MKEFEPLLNSVCRGESLDRRQAREAMRLLVCGCLEDVQAAAFLGALQSRRIHVEELTGFVEELRGRAERIQIDRSPVVDTCGTGGDGLGSFNFSTAAALVVAATGVAVAKHGNRSVSSRAGSADVLESLGVAIDDCPARAKHSIEEYGFGFLFAPNYHPSMKAVASLRRSLGVRTVFNLLGPLLNPAFVTRQVIGIYDASLLEAYASVLLALGAERALVVAARDGMDEMSLTGPTEVCHVENGQIRLESVSPEDAGLQRADPESLRGGDSPHNARSIVGVLEGEPGPLADGTIFNAAAALIAAGRADSFKEGVTLARESICLGRAARLLDDLRRLKTGRPA